MKAFHLLQHMSLLCYTVSMKLSSYAKHIGIHDNTAWRMWKRGQLSGYQLPTGTVIVEPPEQQPAVSPPKQHLVAFSARASRSENNEESGDASRMADHWCNAAVAGRSAKSSKNAGAVSTISVPRFSLCWPIKRSAGWWWSTRTGHLVLAPPPFKRCSRGLGWELVVVNTADTVQDDLMSDFVAIITLFAARLYGRRRAKRKTEQVLAV